MFLWDENLKLLCVGTKTKSVFFFISFAIVCCLNIVHNILKIINIYLLDCVLLVKVPNKKCWTETKQIQVLSFLLMFYSEGKKRVSLKFRWKEIKMENTQFQEINAGVYVLDKMKDHGDLPALVMVYTNIISFCLVYGLILHLNVILIKPHTS